MAEESSTSSSRDREAKELAQRSGSDAPPGPGTLPSEAASRAPDDQAAKEKARRTGSDNVKPGAQSSNDSVDRSTRKEERNAARNSESGKPGVQASDASQDPATRKQQRNMELGAGVPTKESATEPPQQSAPLDSSDAYQVEAVAISEDTENERVRKLEEQMQAMLASQAAAVPAAQVTTPARANIFADSDDELESDNDNQPCCVRYKWILLVLVVLAIGGGVAGYVLGASKEPAPAPLPENPTMPPNDNKATTSPTSAPTTFLIFEPPSEAECFAIANGVPLNGQEYMNKTSVGISFDVSLITDSDTTSTWLTPFEQGLKSHFVPALAGCPSSRRRLRQIRELQEEEEDNPSRYAIANADTSVAYLPNESCASGAASPCKRVQVILDLFVMDEYVTFFDVVTIIYDVVNVPGNVEVFGLSTDQFKRISIAGIDNLSPTEAPSPKPTMAPNSTPPPTPLQQVSRKAFLQSLLSSHSPINTQALNWLADTDTWEPPSDAYNAGAQWVERYVMAVFYFATNGSGWSDTGGWLSPTSVCSGWFGINDCQSDLVRELWIPSNNLVGTLPTELGLLTSLTVLALFENNIFGTIPKELGMLSRLTSLELDMTRVSGRIPTELGKLILLEELYAFDSFITGTIPSEIGKLTNLRFLEVQNAQLQGSIPEQLWQLTRLESLFVFNTGLEGTISTKIGQLRNLKDLQIDECNFSGSIPSEIGRLSFLTQLTAFTNNFDGSIPTEIGRLTALTGLSLANTFLTGTIPSEIVFLSSLQWLYLSENNLVGDVPPLPPLLEECDLDANCFSDFRNALARNCLVDNSSC